MEVNNINISEFNNGLHSDNSLNNQPKNTQRFALNTINETTNGDEFFRSNEESNEQCVFLKDDFVPIGKCYIGNNETIIFSVSKDNSISEIGVLNDNCQYQVFVNDETSSNVNKLNFKVEHQIQATFRLRRGCERTVYFTDNYNKPRYYNLDKPENFSENGFWIGKKFDLFKTINVLPKINKVKVLENTGSLLAGSYSILFQYLDEDYNGTKFLELISNINIINDSLKNSYVDIEGSTNIAVDSIKSPATSKAIEVKIDNLDKTYVFFRLAIIEYTNGTGQISSVKYSSAISTETNNYIYTGTNASENGTIEEVELASINAGIYKVGTLEQIDNKLILADISGPQYKYCNLQKYASRIKADVIVKNILLTSVNEDHNSKNPLVHYNGLSHQPGDIYSYGIVYVFEDLTESPVFHIPGKNNSLDNNMTFTLGQANVKGMKSSNNKNLSEYYNNTNACNINDYWGLDSEGQSLTGTNVRHHRFPTREEINIGFVEEISGSTNTLYKKLSLQLLGNIKKSLLCTPSTVTDCPGYYKAPVFTLTVKYKLNGINKEFTSPNISEFNTSSFVYSNIFLDTDTVTDIQLWYKESGSSSVQIVLNSGTSSLQTNLLVYKIEEISSEEETGIVKYQVPILGIKFSGVDLPSEEDINGKIIGYKIVRQERKDSDKNILDSAIVLPMMTNNIGQGNFISSSMIAPLLDNVNYSYNAISKNTVQLLSPLHKFTDKNFEGYTTIEEVGKFNLLKSNVTANLTQDVQPGSSADGVKDISDNTEDNDGFSLKQMVRMSKVKYNNSNSNKLIIDNVNTDLFNLQPLKTATHSDETSTITNLSCDNKSLILSKKDLTVDYNRYKSSEQYYPYVYIKKDNTSFYSNYRSNVYYQTDHILHDFSTNSCELYSGDTHISPLKYTNHIYGNTTIAPRYSDFNWAGFVTAVLITIFAIATAIITFGASAPASVAAITFAVGSLIVSAGSIALFVAGAIDAQDFANLYQEKWAKGLDFTLFDIVYQQLFYNPNLNFPRNQLNFRDDTIKWYGETVQDFWFESTLNLSLRVSYTNNIPNYLKPLTTISASRPDKINFLIQTSLNNEVDNVDDYRHYRDDSLNWESYEENYFSRKILDWKDNKWNYRGISEAVLYMLNNDHNVNKNIIKYYSLPQEYDCCSDCIEKFPHRWIWSEESFQEEKTDNYRMFLPNNYKDIFGETGKITNIFKINNDLFLHTEEALYQIPRNYQERVTDQVITFIGTGSYGELPERKMIDDDTGSSAGSQHKWSTIKTPNGVFFVSENQRKIYQFEGNQLKPISSIGLNNWFENNTQLLLNKQYYNSTGKKYSYNDNPSNLFGTGFISTYDTKKERIIFTKKDFLFSSNITNNSDFEICVNNGQLVQFSNYNQIIQSEKLNSWNYEGIKNCKMKFSRNINSVKQETREVVTTLPNNTDIIIQFDSSNSFGSTGVANVKSTMLAWFNEFKNSNPSFQGRLLYLLTEDGCEGQSWLRVLKWLQINDNVYLVNSAGLESSITSFNEISKNIVIVSTVNEAMIGFCAGKGEYHQGNIQNPTPAPSSMYINDFNDYFTRYDNLKNLGYTVYGLQYPIVYTHSNTGATKGMLQHSISAIVGETLTSEEIEILTNNPNTFVPVNEYSVLMSALSGNNPYPKNLTASFPRSLRDIGWQYKHTRGWNGTGDIIPIAQFKQDIESFLSDLTTIETITINVPYVEVEYKYIEGEVVNNPIKADNSWTISYSLKQNSWVSWHSYLPNFYINVPNKFYSWIYGNNYIWKHNKIGHYQTYYDKLNPFILEYVSLSNPLTTRLFEYLMLLVEVKKFDKINTEFVDVNNVFFNKLITYNSRQCSGLLNIKVKDNDKFSNNYLYEQINNTENNEIIVDRNERNWTINNLRDIRTNYNESIFISDLSRLQNNYFIDKILNENSIDYNKEWSELESFRDKYLVVRLIFDNFASNNEFENGTIKVIMNFSGENETQSFR